MSKHILGLDLGTTSIGWAHVIEGQRPEESSIVDIGVRVNPLTTDEQTNFEKGKPITTNADRTLKRGARRNLDRFKLRRKSLLSLLLDHKIIDSTSELNEDGKNTTFETWRLRAQAAKEKVELGEFARVLLAINKKRGYKSSRKTKNEDGKAIDGMSLALRMYEGNLTPGQIVFERLQNGLKAIPEFYRSDLEKEFNQVWEFQKSYYPEILTNDFYNELRGKGLRATSSLFGAKYGFNTADIKSIDDDLKNEKTVVLHLRDQKKLQAYKWRKDAISTPLEKEQLAYVLAEINNNLNNSSGYLGAISDRSKELYFNKQTVGQYLYDQLTKNRHNSLKNKVFYRQDYLDEFETIWSVQRQFHPVLTDQLKDELRDIVIFYQRKLKSQKGLVSLCEFEQREVEVGGKKKIVGLRVAPKSSPLFQEFKIWQLLNNLLVRKAGSKKRTAKTGNADQSSAEIFSLNSEQKQLLFEELNVKGNLKSSAVLDLLGLKSKEWELNYSELEGNHTNRALYNAFLRILEVEGYNEELLKLSDKDEIDVAELKAPASEIVEMVMAIFQTLGIDTSILQFDAELDGKQFEEQASYRLWHLLYSAEDDNCKYDSNDVLTFGNEDIGLKKLLCSKYGFKPEHAKILASIAFKDDYGNLSTKAMRRIYPYIKESNYSDACAQAGYRHSKHSLTKDELENRELKDKLQLLAKNSLRNPVVEKILNQMVNVVNALIERENNKLQAEGKDRNFHFDEIRVELARELKKNAKERAEMTTSVNAGKNKHEKIFKILQSEFGIKHPTKNDIIRYKLYEELKNNGYHDLYTNTYIPRELLFSKEVDIEHIIPQSRVFDDSFSNKTVVFRQTNLDKGNQTAFDYILNKYGEKVVVEYELRLQSLFEQGKKNIEEGISKAKYLKLLKTNHQIGEGFIERDLRDSQYIAKKAKSMLFDITRSVVSTSGSITDRLREDWGLVNVMKEINLPKYRALGLTEMQERKFGNKIEIIKDWTKRNDHRHHAMDALTVAFTKHSHIQYLNFLNARKDENHKLHNHIMGIERLETELREDDKGTKKRIFREPIPNFRAVAKEFLEGVIVSHKAKNKVVTKNKNKTSGNVKIQEVLTPRGQLHKETVYGQFQSYQQKEERVTAKFDRHTIEKVTNPVFRDLLIKRLEENGNDPKKAFSGKNSIEKNPIFIDPEKTKKLPEKVKLVWLERNFSIRKDITPENFKDEKAIDKILDEGVKSCLMRRLTAFDGDAKKAFSDLDKNPIWLNEEKGICVKRAAISGVSNAEPLHHKKDHFGNLILDKNGNKIPVDFISTGSNHHVAIYKDAEGNLQDNVISFYEAVSRLNHSLPVVDKGYNAELGWQFLFSMKQNEVFVFPDAVGGFYPEEIDLLDPENKGKITSNLFRVQKFSKVFYGNSAVREYVFRHHLETNVDEKKELKDIAFKNIKSLGYFDGIIKVRINHLGDIVSVGEG